MSPTYAVETRDLSKRFGRFFAVRDLSLTIGEGEIFGFLGSNGAGKSTAIRMLCGLLRPSGGWAKVLGIDVSRDPEQVKRHIGYMSQRFSLYEDLTVSQNLRFFGGVYGLEGAEYRQRADWALATASLEGKEDLLAGSLPGGWKQRLALACAVLHRPKVLFLDEPTGGVDPISRRSFWRLIDQLSAEGVTILVTTHYMDEAEHCDRIAFMHAGRLVALGGMEELRSVFAGSQVLEVLCPRPLAALEALARDRAVLESSVFGVKLHVVVPEGDAHSRRVQAVLEERGFSPVTLERVVPSLEDVFIHSISRAEGSLERGPEAA